MAEHDEKVSVYDTSTKMFPSIIEVDVKSICDDKIATDYSMTLKETKLLYECNKMSIFGTDYKRFIHK